MGEKIKLVKNLDDLQKLVLVCCDEEGKRYIGTISYFGGDIQERRYLSVLYKDPLPEGDDLMACWNWLDDNSVNVYLDYTSSMELGVADFLSAHNCKLNSDELAYQVVEDYGEINSRYHDEMPKINKVLVYAFLK